MIMKISRTYLILSVLLAGLAFVLVLLPKTTRNKEIQPDKLLIEINDPARFVNPDFIAERLINEDPSLQLVDVRTKDQFSKFTLPGAVNIPLNEMSNEEWDESLNQEDKDVILFSNDDLYADQAWIICARQGYKNIYVMKGGLNLWFKDILSPEKPSETASKEEFETYYFRKAAAQYFRGPSSIIKTDIAPSNVELKKKEKKISAEGGC